MGAITYGVASIEMGDLANDGGPGTDLDSLGFTVQGSCRLNQDDPTDTSFFAEEQDEAVEITTRPGAKSLTFQLLDPDPDTLKILFGGDVAGTTTKTWSAPATTPTIEKTVKVTPKKGMVLTIVRGNVVAKFNGEFTKDNPMVIDITVTILAPTKAGVAPFSWALATA